MLKLKPKAALAAAILAAGCTQTAGTPAPGTSGPVNPNMVGVFTLAVQPGSIEGCMLADSSMTRPITVTVTANNTALFDTDGGIHDVLKPIRPNVYADLFQIGFLRMNIEADFSVRPKRLLISTVEGDCKWAATAP